MNWSIMKKNFNTNFENPNLSLSQDVSLLRTQFNEKITQTSFVTAPQTSKLQTQNLQDRISKRFQIQSSLINGNKK